MFKNLVPYRLPVPWQISLSELEEQLGRGLFFECPKHEPMSRGWVPPRKDGALVAAVDNCWLIALCVEERLLPASVVSEEVAKEVAKLTESQGHAPGRKQLRELKERTVERLLPKAFTRKKVTRAWIDPKGGWFCIDASSRSKADALIEHLRHCLDNFPLMPLNTQTSPASAMADWLAGGDAPDGYTIDRDCELKACGEEKKAVAYKRHPLADEVGDEIKAHIAAGKMPTKLALTWDDRLSFVITEKLELKRLTIPDILKEQAEQSAEDAEEQFDADFAIISGEIKRLLPSITEVLGGEVVE